MFRAAKQGRACVAVLDGKDVGVALVVKDKLLALSVAVSAQGRGVGPALMAHLRPQWVSAIAEKVGFFAKLGYTPVGAAAVGKNGKHATQLMQLTSPDAMRSDQSGAAPAANAPPTPTTPQQDAPPTPLDLLGDMPMSEDAHAELMLLDGLYTQAVAAMKFESALTILDRAKRLVRS